MQLSPTFSLSNLSHAEWIIRINGQLDFWGCDYTWLGSILVPHDSMGFGFVSLVGGCLWFYGGLGRMKGKKSISIFHWNLLLVRNPTELRNVVSYIYMFLTLFPKFLQHLLRYVLIRISWIWIFLRIAV